MPQDYSFLIIDMINSASRAWKASPLILGGVPTSSGGGGSPPGGFVGYLPQKRVAYDTVETASSGIPPSGASLYDNLCHIRYRLNVLESSSGVSGGHVIEDSTTEFTQRSKLQFLGSGITIVDDSINDRTIVTVSGSSSIVTNYTLSGVGTVVSPLIVASGIFAPIASGVYGGSSHIHHSGDGGQISYADLSNVPMTSGWYNYSGVMPTSSALGSADPVFLMSFNAGDIRSLFQEGQPVTWKQNNITRYGWIVAEPQYGGSTTILVLTRCDSSSTDYDVLHTSDYPITEFKYGLPKQPGMGFPVDPIKWTVVTKNTSNEYQATPTQNVWYNIGSISITVPQGAWNLSYVVDLQEVDASSAAWTGYCTLSTGADSESDVDFTSVARITSTTTMATLSKQKDINLASETVYFLNSKTSNAGLDDIYNRGDFFPTTLIAKCNYL